MALLNLAQSPSNALLLAISGGSDSISLLRLLADSDYNISVAHFDHALRASSSHDAAFVKNLCSELAVPFYSKRVEVAKIAREKGLNLEDAARRLRYSFLTHTARNINAAAIVTAHTLNDQAETVLMQLLRGAAFLKGMKARQGFILRPMLSLTKQKLLEYLQELQQSYCLDQTNFDTSFTRAWLRHEILPKLEQRYPNIQLTLARLAQLQQAQVQHFDKLADCNNCKEATIPKLIKQDIAVQRYTIAQLIKGAGIASDFEHIETIRTSFVNTHPQQISLPQRKLARIAYGKLSIIDSTPQKAKDSLPDFSIQTLQELEPNINLEIDFDKLLVFNNLKLRYRQAGDRIKLVGGTKKLADLFIDRKIPKEARAKIILLAHDSQVLWVQGVAVDVRIAKKQINSDAKWMKIALGQAQIAAQQGELPVGAVIIKDQKLISQAANTTEADHDSTAHAEMLAIRKASSLLKDWRLTECTLYTTLEPCPMCFGAMLQAHLPTVVYAADNYREGALGGVENLQNFAWKGKLEVRSGVLGKVAAELLSDFFAKLR